jgi:cell division protein FtsL
VTRQRDSGALLRLGMLLFCGLTLASGFVYAGGQHFAALKLGYETENLRKIRNDLVEEQHRFQLAHDAAVSPARLEQAARQLGMQPMQAAQIDPLKRPARTSVETTIDKASPEISTVERAAPTRQAQAKMIRQPKPDEQGPTPNQTDRARTR